MAKNRVIGADNKLPWHLSADLKRFKALTMGHHIIMGRRTFESIGRPLPGRTNIVISRNPSFVHEGIAVAGNLETALALGAGDSEIFVIGGEQIYRAALPVADRLYVTEIGKDYVGETLFPAVTADHWHEAAREEYLDDAQDLRCAFITYDRVKPSDAR